MFDGALYQEPQVVRVLRAAREVLAVGWTQYCQARDKDGRGTDATHGNAVSWCLGGAVMKATGDFLWRGLQSVPAMNLLDEEAVKRGHVGLASFNNAAGSVENVYGLIDAAIETALTREAAHV